MLNMLLYENGGTTPFIDDLMNVLFWIFLVVNALLLPFCIYLAFKFTTASNEERRRSAKTRFINVLATFGIILLIIIVLGTNVFGLGWAGSTNRPPPGNGSGPGPGPNGPGPITGQGVFNMPVGRTNGLPPRWNARGLWGSNGEGNRFGPRSSGNHAGVDINTITVTGSRGEPVYAAATGILIRRGTDQRENTLRNNPDCNSGGVWVEIRHVGHGLNGETLYTIYMHLSPSSLAIINSLHNQQVAAGQKIGYTGRTGATNSNSAYVHFKVAQTSGGRLYRFDPFNPTFWFRPATYSPRFAHGQPARFHAMRPVPTI